VSIVSSRSFLAERAERRDRVGGMQDVRAVEVDVPTAPLHQRDDLVAGSAPRLIVGISPPGPYQ
jgi:hypothetical protein